MYMPSKETAITMVNMSETVRLIQDSVIHLSVLLIIVRCLKKTIVAYFIKFLSSKIKKNNSFIIPRSDEIGHIQGGLSLDNSFIIQQAFIKHPAYTLHC